MSKFQDTVEKLASSPRKVQLLQVAPHFLVKTAAPAGAGKAAGKAAEESKDILVKLFGGKDAQGWQKMLQTVGAGVASTAAVGAGTLLASQLEDRFLGNADQAKATNQAIGQLNAANQFKTQMVLNLEPSHKSVLKTVLKDEVISNADEAMITSAFETMKRFAPNLAADENATRSFLREHAIYGTGPSYASLKNLADAEQAVAKAGGALPM